MQRSFVFRRLSRRFRVSDECKYIIRTKYIDAKSYQNCITLLLSVFVVVYTAKFDIEIAREYFCYCSSVCFFFVIQNQFIVISHLIKHYSSPLLFVIILLLPCFQTQTMYWPVLLHNSCLLIILCGLVTISQATETYDPIIDRRGSAHAVPQNPSAPSSSATPLSQQHHQQQQQQKMQQQTIYPQQTQQQSKHVATTAVYHHGSGSHNIESVSRNSYAMLSQAMSQAVSHEFSKWLRTYLYISKLC